MKFAAFQANLSFPYLPEYHQIPIICLGLIFIQKAFLVDVFSGKLIFGGADSWREFCVSNWVGHDDKNSLKL